MNHEQKAGFALRCNGFAAHSQAPVLACMGSGCLKLGVSPVGVGLKIADRRDAVQGAMWFAGDAPGDGLLEFVAHDADDVCEALGLEVEILPEASVSAFAASVLEPSQ